jgi:DnaJ-class molecular chaperone
VQNKRNYYRVLHVQPDAPTEIIRMSYLTLMQRLKMHPDLGGDHAQAALINEAFATLVDPERRAIYDRTLARERAYPGYRSKTAARERESADISNRSNAAFACAFCGTPHGKADARRVDGVCRTCESPLYPAARHDRTPATRRAVTRLPKQLPITFHLSWPQPAFAGTTNDVSTQGMRFTTTVDLVPNERIRIDCSFCSAVGVVRHSRIAPGPPGRWDIGVEFLTLLIKPSRGVLVSVEA